MVVQENLMKRRDFLKVFLSAATVATLSSRAHAQAGVKEIRIGYQKNGVLVIARQQANLENHFKPLGIEVKWVEFSWGPPPVFPQAAGPLIFYAAGQPVTNGQGILVPQNSEIRSIADLNGKRVGFTK